MLYRGSIQIPALKIVVHEDTKVIEVALYYLGDIKVGGFTSQGSQENVCNACGGGYQSEYLQCDGSHYLPSKEMTEAFSGTIIPLIPAVGEQKPLLSPGD